MYSTEPYQDYSRILSYSSVAIYYFGPGKLRTGDWCFSDGFITFRELAEMYLHHFRERILTISTDCSYAGSWVKALVEFLGDMDTKPCGHQTMWTLGQRERHTS